MSPLLVGVGDAELRIRKNTMNEQQGGA